MSEDTKDYEVGYGKPPKHCQFKKGQSGNPKGKPKGSRDLKTDVLAILNSRIVVNENGQTRKVSTQRATLMRLREKALKGDARAMERLLTLAADYNNDGASRNQTSTSTNTDDSAILENYRKRILGETKKDKKTDPADEKDNND